MKFNVTLKSPQVMLDKAFRRAKDVSSSLPGIRGQREKAINKISTVENVLRDELMKVVNTFPKVDKFSSFHKELFSTYISISKYKRCLYHMKWTSMKIQEISYNARESVKFSKNKEQIVNILKSYYGRVSSLIEDLDKCINVLIDASNVLRRMPEINTDKVVFVVSGYPNVGKSSLIKALTSANVKVEPYPFTTQDLLIGESESFILVDTPGLLEKNFERLNEIEKKGYLALKHLSSYVIFVIDPSLSSGYSVDDQISLLENIKKHFSPSVLVLVYTKMDLMDEKIITKHDNNAFFVSSVTMEGIKELKSFLEKISFNELSKRMKSYA